MKKFLRNGAVAATSAVSLAEAASATKTAARGPRPSSAAFTPSKSIGVISASVCPPAAISQ